MKKEYFKHVLMVGTNRKIEGYIESYIDELQYMSSKLGYQVPLIVIEDGTDDIERENNIILCKLSNENPHLIIKHIGKEKKKKFFLYLKESGINDDIIKLLDFDGISYGRILNMQFLIATALGADYIHRRDSDTRIDKKFGFPAEMELAYLGRKVSEVAKETNCSKKEFLDEQRIYLAGSGYSGGADWKLDYTLFKKQDLDLIFGINELFHIPQELSKQYYTEVKTGNNQVKNEVELITGNLHSNPDCGNIAFYMLHKLLPCSPMLDTIGSDYFITYLLKATRNPLLYHNHFVFHGFTAERNATDLSYSLPYWLRVVNMMDYYDCLDTLVFDKFTGKPYKDIMDMKTENLFENKVIDLDYRLEKIEKFALLFLNAKEKLIQEIGLALQKERNKMKIITTTDTGIVNHKILLENWRELIRLSEQYNQF